MSLAHTLRRRRDRSTPDKPQVERIEHANLERPGARLHPRAMTAPPPARPDPWSTRSIRPLTWPR